MSKVLLVILFLFGTITIGGFYFLSNPSPKPSIQTAIPPSQPPNSKAITATIQNQPVDYKAAFAIYTNGIFRVFTAAMYHNLSEDVYIQAENPNIVHVKKSGVTWDYFFKTLPFSVTRDCLITGTKETFCTNQTKTLKFYLNGARNDNLLNIEIKPNDKGLITYGEESETEIHQQIEQLSLVSIQPK